VKILFLTSAHNSLSQRLLIELTEPGHEIRVCVATSGEAMMDAVAGDAPRRRVATVRSGRDHLTGRETPAAG
jgi:putative two-component system protein, hydrogenase maturation factor HypX/HoxX